MPKPSDQERILRLLAETDGLSNSLVKTELNLSDDRYIKVRDKLITGELIEKYRCQGGGIRLTRKGEKESEAYKEFLSGVTKEASLYTPLMDFLELQAKDDGIEAVVCGTHSLKKRGQWQNPDVTRISIENYNHLRKMHVTITTYEVKQFPNWSVSVVYEAASHHRFSHEAYVVLEWPKGPEFSLTDPTYKLDQIARECQRFGIGLATMHKVWNSHRLRPRLAPRPTLPNDEDVNGWLEYVFSRDGKASKAYDTAIKAANNQLEGNEI